MAVQLDRPWFFGLMREAGGYRIVASGPTEGRVWRELAQYTVPTLVVTLEELPGVGIGEAQWRQWLPRDEVQMNQRSE
jgi:hypothetical protein